MLKGKCAVVTGSTSGIGLAIAERLAHAGANIVLNGFGEAAAIERLRADLAARCGVGVRHSGADMARPDEIAAMMRDAEEAFDGVDVLVNYAGIQDEFPEAKWERTLAINLSSNFYTVRAVLPGMKRRGWGRIVNIASAHGLVASPLKAVGVAAEHGVLRLTRAVALDAGETPITCNAICPGYVKTPLVEGQICDQAKAHDTPEERVVREVVLASQSNKRFVLTSAIADIVLFLCSPAADAITGIALPADGGWTSLSGRAQEREPCGPGLPGAPPPARSSAPPTRYG